MTAADVVNALAARADPSQLATMRKRLKPNEPAAGIRMGDLFAVAKSFTMLPLDQVELLLVEPAYEPRMAAFCILDFRARKSSGDRTLCETYLRHHDRITTWDMVDRAAPWVVGSHVAGGPIDVLHDLAASDDPLRRRTAITAPLWFVKHGTDDDVVRGHAIADLLDGDPDPLVSKPVGIFRRHAAKRQA